MRLQQLPPPQALNKLKIFMRAYTRIQLCIVISAYKENGIYYLYSSSCRDVIRRIPIMELRV